MTHNILSRVQNSTYFDYPTEESLSWDRAGHTLKAERHAVVAWRRWNQTSVSYKQGPLLLVNQTVNAQTDGVIGRVVKEECVAMDHGWMHSSPLNVDSFVCLPNVGTFSFPLSSSSSFLILTFLIIFLFFEIKLIYL